MALQPNDGDDPLVEPLLPRWLSYAIYGSELLALVTLTILNEFFHWIDPLFTRYACGVGIIIHGSWFLDTYKKDKKRKITRETRPSNN